MAIFVHNAPSAPRTTQERPQFDLAGAIRQAKLDAENRSTRQRELDINEGRYQDYLKFRGEELEARKEAERKIGEREDLAYQRELEEDVTSGRQQHNTAVNLLNQINADKKDLLGRVTQAASEVQRLNAEKAAGRPVDSNQLQNWERLARDFTSQIERLDRSAQNIAGQLRHGQILHVNPRTGEYALSEPVLPSLGTAVPGRGDAGSAGGVTRPLFFEPPPGGGGTIPGAIETGSGTGESLPFPQTRIPPPATQAPPPAGIIPSLYRGAESAIVPTTRAVVRGAGQRIGEYASNLGRAVAETPYRYWWSGEPMDVRVRQPELLQRPSFFQEAPALGRRIGSAIGERFSGLFDANTGRPLTEADAIERRTRGWDDLNRYFLEY